MLINKKKLDELVVIMIFYMFFIFAASLASRFEEKEETCFVLATRGASNRLPEITKYIESRYPELNEQDLRMKLTEDAYDFCMQHITSKEIKHFEGTRLREYSEYSHLVKIPLSQYTPASDLSNSIKFSSNRVTIAKRVAMKSLQGKRDL